MKDPIVEEVRKAREKIFKECHYDLKQLLQRALAYQEKNHIKTINLSEEKLKNKLRKAIRERKSNQKKNYIKFDSL